MSHAGGLCTWALVLCTASMVRVQMLNQITHSVAIPIELKRLLLRNGHMSSWRSLQLSRHTVNGGEWYVGFFLERPVKMCGDTGTSVEVIF